MAGVKARTSQGTFKAETVEVTAQVPYNGQALDTAHEFMSRFLIAGDAIRDVMTLWAAHTHAVDGEGKLLFDSSPRLAFISDEPASGKTLALAMLRLIGRNGQVTTDPTPAALVAGISEMRKVILIDEVDILFGKGEAKSIVRSVINSGYRKGATVMRAKQIEQDIFGPMAMAGLGRVFQSAEALAAVRSRCIISRMKQAKGKGEKYRSRLHDGMARAINADLGKWVGFNLGSITENWPELPAGIEDRLAEVWEPLFQIANVAGGSWPERCAKACRELSTGQSTESPESLTMRLVADLETVFSGREKMTTVAMVEGLYALNAGWETIWPNAGVAPRELTTLLSTAPYRLAATPVRVGDKVSRGFKRDDFESHWSVTASDDVESTGQ